MASNTNLKNANRNKKDEFYTLLGDIENEIKYYKTHFKNKIVFCNCDDHKKSEFWRYFHLYFSHLGLKGLVATHYDPLRPTYKIEYGGGGTTGIPPSGKLPL